MMREVSPHIWEERGVFAYCADVAEVILLANRMHGQQFVEALLAEVVTVVPREALRQAADQLAHVGLPVLAKTIRRFARKAKPGPLGFDQQWRAQERKHDVIPLN
jgi:hypothetical protein